MTDITITEGDTLDVSVLAENLGAETEPQTIRLLIDGTQVDSQADVTIEPGIVETLSLGWQTSSGDAGTYTATVESDDDSVSADVDVVAPTVAVTTGTPSGITPETATVPGDLTDATGALEVDASIEYRETGASSWIVIGAGTLSSTGPFSASLSGLSPETEFEARAVGNAVRYPASGTGGTVTFQTDPPFVSVITTSITSVSDTDATVNGELTDFAGVDDVEVGAEYRRQGNSTWQDGPTTTLSSPNTFSVGLSGLQAQTGYEARATAAAVNDDATDVGSIVSFTTDAPSKLEEEFDNFNQWNFNNISSSGVSISSSRVAPNSTNGTAMYATEDVGHGQGVSEFTPAMTWKFNNNQYTRVVWHYNENSSGQGGCGMWGLDNNNNRVFAVGTSNPDPVFFKNGDTNTPGGTSASIQTWYKWIIDIDWSNQTYSLDWNNGSYTGTHNFDGNPSNLAKLRWGAFGSNMNGSFDHYQDDYRVRL